MGQSPEGRVEKGEKKKRRQESKTTTAEELMLDGVDYLPDCGFVLAHYAHRVTGRRFVLSFTVSELKRRYRRREKGKRRKAADEKSGGRVSKYR